MNATTQTTRPAGHAITAAIWVEIQKVRHSKTLWITTLGFMLLALVSGLFMFILKNPELAHRLGLIAAKAQLLGGSADWPGFINQLLLMMSVGSLIIFGFIFVWIFGREFGDKTYFDLLSLPVSRPTIVLAKLFTGAVWSMTLLILVYAVALGLGAGLQLPGWSVSVAVSGLEHLLVSGGLTILLVIPFSLIACITRGYLPAIGGLFLVLVLAQVFNTLGYALFFPWAIPALYSGMAGGTAASPNLVSFVLVILVGLISALTTGLWWQYADQT
jgi:ABC-2 type transport system permease protein